MKAKEYTEERLITRKGARKAICMDELDRDGVEQLHYRFVGTRRAADMTAHEMFAELCRELDIDD